MRTHPRQSVTCCHLWVLCASSRGLATFIFPSRYLPSATLPEARVDHLQLSIPSAFNFHLPLQASRRSIYSRLIFSGGYSSRREVEEAARRYTDGAACSRIESAEMTSGNDHRHWPSSLRNREVIATEVARWLEKQESENGAGHMLEIASGTGCHIEMFAKRLPSWNFTPSEYDEERIPDLVATIESGGYANIQPPERVDVGSDSSTWPRPGAPSAGGSTNLSSWDAVVCINMVHIAPPECSPGLLRGASAVLKMGGLLFIYGPFALNGLLAPQSNRDFNESLKARSDGVWGIKDIVWLTELGDEAGLELTEICAMPANNFFVVFKKVRGNSGRPEGAEGRAARVADRVSAIVDPAKAAFLEKLGIKS